MIVELPTDASDIQAAATAPSESRVALPVQAPFTSIALAFGKRLLAELRKLSRLVRQRKLRQGIGHHVLRCATERPGRFEVLVVARYAEATNRPEHEHDTAIDRLPRYRAEDAAVL